MHANISMWSSLSLTPLAVEQRRFDHTLMEIADNFFLAISMQENPWNESSSKEWDQMLSIVNIKPNTFLMQSYNE